MPDGDIVHSQLSGLYRKPYVKNLRRSPRKNVKKIDMDNEELR